MAVGVMATTAPCASTSVLERMTVMRSLRRLNAAAAATGLGGGEAYDGEHVGGKGVGA